MALHIDEHRIQWRDNIEFLPVRQSPFFDKIEAVGTTNVNPLSRLKLLRSRLNAIQHILDRQPFAG